MLTAGCKAAGGPSILVSGEPQVEERPRCNLADFSPRMVDNFIPAQPNNLPVPPADVDSSHATYSYGRFRVAADFQGANLKGADFSGVELWGVDLSAATLDASTNLEGATLNVEGLSIPAISCCPTVCLPSPDINKCNALSTCPLTTGGLGCTDPPCLAAADNSDCLSEPCPLPPGSFGANLACNRTATPEPLAPVTRS